MSIYQRIQSLRQRIAYCRANPNGVFPIFHADHIAKLLVDHERELAKLLRETIDLG